MVCFDVDSTVCLDEGIDELAAFLGLGDQVKALTASAMAGAMPFEQSLEQRLDLLAPCADAVAEFLWKQPARLTPGVAKLVAALRARGTRVFLLSGGFTQLIYPVAAQLDVDDDHVIANTLLFHPETGDYIGFDPRAPTSRSHGKARAIASLRRHLDGPFVMVGDGATDAETKQPGAADAFIAFCGVVERPAAVAAADWVVRDFATLIDSLHE